VAAQPEVAVVVCVRLVRAPVLFPHDCANQSKLASVSGSNLDWLAHTAMVGAPAAPAQHPCATTQPNNRRRSPRASSTAVIRVT
jgi:hypothetical protein